MKPNICGHATVKKTKKNYLLTTGSTARNSISKELELIHLPELLRSLDCYLLRLEIF